MIQTINIKAFQSHKDTTLDLHEGVNIIVGSTDSGKTAILRALRWAIWNRPSGDAFRSDFGGQTKVTITTEEGHVISRSKDTGENLYELDGIEFAAFKTDVPEEIVDVLNINETNFQRQFDMPYLLTDSPGEIAVHFNKIAHIDKIDTSIKKVSSWIRDIEQDIKGNEKNIDQSVEELQQYEYLDALEEGVDALEQKQEALDTLQKTNERLYSLLSDIESTTNEIEKKSPLLQLEEEVNTLLGYFKAISSIKKDKSTLYTLIEDIKRNKAKTAEFDKLLAVEDNIKDLLTLHSSLRNARKEKKLLETSLDTIARSLESLTKSENKVIELQKLFKKEMGDHCILCGTKL